MANISHLRVLSFLTQQTELNQNNTFWGTRYIKVGHNDNGRPLRSQQKSEERYLNTFSENPNTTMNGTPSSNHTKKVGKTFCQIFHLTISRVF